MKIKDKNEALALKKRCKESIKGVIVNYYRTFEETDYYNQVKYGVLIRYKIDREEKELREEFYNNIGKYLTKQSRYYDFSYISNSLKLPAEGSEIDLFYNPKDKNEIVSSLLLRLKTE